MGGHHWRGGGRRWWLGGSVLARWLDALERRRGRGIALVEETLNRVTHEQRVLQEGLAHWKAGHSLSDERVLANSRALIDAIETVWVSEDLMRINFGQESPVVAALNEVIAVVDDMKDALGYRSQTLSPADWDAWESKRVELVHAKKRYIEAVRFEARS